MREMHRDTSFPRGQIEMSGRRFEENEDELLGAYRAVAQRVFDQIRPTTGASDWSDAARVALGGLLSVLESDPDGMRVLLVDGLTGGRRMREQRRCVLSEFERQVQEFLDSPPKDGTKLDIPVTAVMGALRNVVASHLRTHTDDRLPSLMEDGLAWLTSYAIPAGQARWSTGPRSVLPRTPRPPASIGAHSQRERLLHGTAEVMMTKGYANATIADIVAQAGLSTDVFYEYFTGKQNAFLEAQQYPTQFVLDACATAYFGARDWPERVWNCLETLLRLIASNPAISHLRLVECYAAGPAAIRRAEEITRSFTFFLEEGYGYRAQGRELPRLCSETIVGAIFEILQRHVARGHASQLPLHLPEITYVAVAPFTGPREAIELLEQLSARSLSRHACIHR